MLRQWGPLLLLTGANAVFLSLYALVRVYPSESALAIPSYSFAFFVVLWVLGDARRHRSTPCFDFGFFLAVGFPVSVAWYLFWSKGLRGLLVLGALAGLFIAPWLCASAAGALSPILRRIL
jgi:hypothetical protein